MRSGRRGEEELGHGCERGADERELRVVMEEKERWIREKMKELFLEERRGDKVGQHAGFTTQKERRASGGRTHATKRR